MDVARLVAGSFPHFAVGVGLRLLLCAGGGGGGGGRGPGSGCGGVGGCGGVAGGGGRGGGVGVGVGRMGVWVGVPCKYPVPLGAHSALWGTARGTSWGHSWPQRALPCPKRRCVAAWVGEDPGPLVALPIPSSATRNAAALTKALLRSAC